MHKAKTNPQGLALPQEQMDKDTRGKDIINLTDEIRYPGMVSYQNAKYEFTSEDSPQKVAEWFMANLKGASDNKNGDEWFSARISLFDFKCEKTTNPLIGSRLMFRTSETLEES